jgi:GT2 family glycosyltransferase
MVDLKYTNNMNKEFPFASVVVITFNRSDFIVSCLGSLAHQTYPNDCYEVIVVDDHSTDNTAAIVQDYGHGVRLIRHDTNRGIPSARNTGIAAAQGAIIAFIDDDAVADPHWLEQLVAPFNMPDITGSGGQTVAYKTEFLTERYLSAVGYGNPAPIEYGKSKNPLRRFLVYIKSMFQFDSIATTPTEVQAVFGLNCAFRATALRSIGGFDERLLADEDAEICTRLRGLGAHIIFIPTALIRHRHREHLWRLARQTYHRTHYTIDYYAKEKKIPPIFPIPLLYIAIAIFLVIFFPVSSIIFVIFSPVLLYSWWPIRALKKKRFEYFFYGYVQLLLESAAILGMTRGEIIYLKQRRV